MRRLFACSISLAAISAFAQPPATVSFEVSTVRRVLPIPGSPGRRVTGGPGTDDPTHFTYLGAMVSLLQAAFGIKDDQLENPPDWTRETRFQIEARVPPGATKEQLQLMLQNLLRERFGFAFHMGKKQVDVFAISVAKSGPKLKPAAPPNGPPPDHPERELATKLDKDGFPELPAGYTASARTGCAVCTGAIRMTFRKSSPADLAVALGRGALRIYDETGLTGPYDFTLEYDPESFIALIDSPFARTLDNPAPGNASDIFTAFEKQLGLKFEKRKALVDSVFIDHLNREPSAD